MKIRETCIDLRGRYILTRVTIDSVDLQLLNIYAPNKEKEQLKFYQSVNNLLQKHKSANEKVIVGGDTNVIMNPVMDRKGGSFLETNEYKKVRKEIDRLIDGNNLCDIWRNRNPESKRFTWRRQNPQIHSRLDIWLVSDVCQDYCSEVDIIPSIRSDHSAIILNMKESYNVTGKGYWKLNNSCLCERYNWRYYRLGKRGRNTGR